MRHDPPAIQQFTPAERRTFVQILASVALSRAVDSIQKNERAEAARTAAARDDQRVKGADRHAAYDSLRD